MTASSSPHRGNSNGSADGALDDQQAGASHVEHNDNARNSVSRYNHLPLFLPEIVIYLILSTDLTDGDEDLGRDIHDSALVCFANHNFDLVVPRRFADRRVR